MWLKTIGIIYNAIANVILFSNLFAKFSVLKFYNTCIKSIDQSWMNFICSYKYVLLLSFDFNLYFLTSTSLFWGYRGDFCKYLTFMKEKRSRDKCLLTLRFSWYSAHKLIPVRVFLPSFKFSKAFKIQKHWLWLKSWFLFLYTGNE